MRAVLKAGVHLRKGGREEPREIMDQAGAEEFSALEVTPSFDFFLSCLVYALTHRFSLRVLCRAECHPTPHKALVSHFS